MGRNALVRIPMSCRTKKAEREMHPTLGCRPAQTHSSALCRGMGLSLSLFHNKETKAKRDELTVTCTRSRSRERGWALTLWQKVHPDTLQLTLEPHGFKMHRSAYTWTFSTNIYSTVSIFSLAILSATRSPPALW